MTVQPVVSMPPWIRPVEQRPALLVQLQTAPPQCKMQPCHSRTPAPRLCQVVLLSQPVITAYLDSLSSFSTEICRASAPRHALICYQFQFQGLLVTCKLCVVVLAEAAQSSADAVSDTASDLLGGVSNGVSAARDAAQQLLDSANSAAGDLRATAGDFQVSVNSSLSSAFHTLQAATASAVGASGSPFMQHSLC